MGIYQWEGGKKKRKRVDFSRFPHWLKTLESWKHSIIRNKLFQMYTQKRKTYSVSESIFTKSSAKEQKHISEKITNVLLR